MDETPADLAEFEPRGYLSRLSRKRRAIVFVLVLAGLCAAAGGALGLRQSWHPRPTANQLAAAERTESGSRWRLLTAGQIFPSLIYYVTRVGERTAARLVGIAPAAPCASATDSPVGAVLATHGCDVMLRATYTDTSGTLVATAGIAVMPDGPAAGLAYAQAPRDGFGLDAVSFPDTAAGQFGNPQRAGFWSQRKGRYIEFIVAGFADGRITRTTIEDRALSDFTAALLGYLSVGGLIAPPANPCDAPDIRC